MITGKPKAEWESRGYRFAEESQCLSCRAPIVWAITPNGCKIPMSEVEGGLVSHFADCPNAKQHRNPKSYA